MENISLTGKDFTTNVAFNGADELWRNVRYNVANECGTWGSASEGEVLARPDWDGPVKFFLRGQITFAEMEAALHIP